MEMMLRSERAERGHTMRMDPRSLLAIGRMVRLAVRHGRLPRHQTALLARRQATLEPYRGRDWSQALLPELLAQLDELVLFRNDTYWLFFVSVMGMAVRNAFLRRWVERRAGDVPFNDLIRGLTGLRSLEPMREIGRLAELARQLPPDLKQDLLVASPEELQVRLGASPVGRMLLTDVGSFLGRFGFLSSNGSDFTASTWADNPILIWRAVARAAANADAASPPAAGAAREEARQHVRGRLNPVERRVFDSLLASVTAAIELRESVGLMMSEYSYQIRRIFLVVAERLASQGDLAEREDLFYLAYDEMIALVGGCLQIDEARARIAARRTEIEADAQITPPNVISGNPELAHRATLPELEVDAYLSGIAGSSGIAQGRARVVNDPAEAPASLGREDILVVPYSDVGWTPLFASIGGIVAETGGQLSHAAIVAREYGLPAVVAVKGATRLIRDGQQLSVDGNRGRVYLVSQPVGDGGDSWNQ
jgi:rifampicin phosphotransferase